MPSLKRIVFLPFLLLIASCNKNQYVDSDVFSSNLPVVDSQQFNHADVNINYLNYSGGTMSNEHVVLNNETINETYHYQFLKDNGFICDHDNGGGFVTFLSLVNTVFNDDGKIVSSLGIEQSKEYERKYKINPLEIDYFYSDSISNDLEKATTKVTAAFKFDEFGYPTHVSVNELFKYRLVYGGKTTADIKTEVKMELSIQWRSA